MKDIYKNSTFFKKIDDYDEIWDAYGPYVNDGIKKRPFYQRILVKTVVDIVAFFFD